MNQNDELAYREYMEKIGDSDRDVLIDLFERAGKTLQGFTLSMKYKFPLWDGNGKFGIAYRGKYIALYFHHEKLAEYVETLRDELGPFTLSGEGLRYKRASDIPVNGILELLLRLFVN